MPPLKTSVEMVSTFYEDLPNMEKSMFVDFAPGSPLNAVNEDNHVGMA